MWNSIAKLIKQCCFLTDGTLVGDKWYIGSESRDRVAAPWNGSLQHIVHQLCGRSGRIRFEAFSWAILQVSIDERLTGYGAITAYRVIGYTILYSWELYWEGANLVSYKGVRGQSNVIFTDDS